MDSEAAVLVVEGNALKGPLPCEREKLGWWKWDERDRRDCHSLDLRRPPRTTAWIRSRNVDAAWRKRDGKR
jgi:hypothetical protein